MTPNPPGPAPAHQASTGTRAQPSAAPADRRYLLERVDDGAVVQLYADGFSDLPLRERILTWHLYQAAIAGRDIFYDQRYAHNLVMRDVLEAIVQYGDTVDPATLDEIVRYTKLFWIHTGPYYNLTARKFVLACSPEAFRAAAHAAAAAGARFPHRDGESLDDLLSRLQPMFFDPLFQPAVTSKTPPPGMDILAASANNLYSNLSMTDLEGFHEQYPLNSRLVKRGGGQIAEEVYRVDGRYGAQIAEIVRHLEQAIPLATHAMQRALRALVEFYRSGEEVDRERYDAAWVQDRESPVDTINGFVEVYLDSRSIKGAWEALVFYVNLDKTRQIRTIAADAQWFEDHMPWDLKYRKDGVRGVSANAIDVVIETGESGPITPVGINLPNDQRIRERHGSKSVSLSNVSEAYDRSTPPELYDEFSWSAEEARRAKAWSAVASELTTNMHEVIGHGSGQMNPLCKNAPAEALKEHFSAVEESRADLVALYFLPDRRLVELELVEESVHEEIVRAEYEAYARNALLQLRRIREGNQIEEDHMRNRQMVVHWLMADTSAIEARVRDGKTCYVVGDVAAFRAGVGRLLAEIQRIKGEGDYPAAKMLFETYGVHFDPALRDEVVQRVDRLRLPSYTAFVMPRLVARTGDAGAIHDVEISYPCDLMSQMLEYSAATRHLREDMPNVARA